MKRILVLLICFNIVLAPTYVFATTVVAEGWSVTKRLVQGATTFFDGTKNIVLNGKNYAATGTAAITPAADQVAKMIVRTGAVLAVDLAIKALIGSVDYVMDPTNNQVKYTVVKDPNSTYVYHVIDKDVTSPTAACNYYYSKQSYKEISNQNSLVKNGGASVYCSATIKYSCMQGTSTCSTSIAYEFYRVAIVTGDKEEKTLPYSAVATQIISDAISEKADSKAYVSSVADTALESDESRQIIGADQVVQQLNSSQSIPTTTTATGTATPSTTGTGTGEPISSQPAPYNITINFPEACGWMPSICSGLQSVVNYLNGFNTWLNEFGKDTSLPNNEKPEFETQSVSPTENYISWAASCPPDAHVPVELYGTHSTITFSWAPWCELLSIIKPAIVFSAYMGAAFIVLGLRT